MTTFKQKEFSSPATRVIFRAKQAGNGVKSAMKLTPKKTKVQLARETITLKNSALDKAARIKTAIETASVAPGQAVSSGVETFVRNPAYTATYVATAPLPVPSMVVSDVVNRVAKKVPAYTRATSRLGDAWRNSKAANKLSGITSDKVNRFVNMIPLA